MIAKHPRWVYLLPLPLLHLGACAIIALANIESGVHYLIDVDFPFSFVLVVLGWRNDNFLLWFATLGTLWWCLLELGSLRNVEQTVETKLTHYPRRLRVCVREFH